MVNNSHKVLIIVYYWPPSGGSGVQRWMYFAKYLPDFGIVPIVLTVDPGKASYKDIDRTNCDKVKDIKVFKTNTFELLKLYSYIVSGNSTQGIPQGHVGSKRNGIFGILSNFIRANLFIPDARVGWNSYAIKKAGQIIEQDNIKIIITSGPPHSSHLIGKKLKEKYNIKWIADFRDPWSEIYYNKDLKRLQWAVKKDEQLELQVLKSADVVLTIGPSMVELLSAKVPERKDKFQFIYNGYDKELMHQIERSDDGFFKLTFIGQFALAQPHEGLLNALELFCKEHVNDAKKIKVTFAGTMDELIVNKFQKLPGITFHYLGRIPHTHALKLMKNSQVLLNSLADTETSKILISGKLMEYISTGNPILCIGDPDGDAASLLKTVPNTKMSAKDDAEGMLDFLNQIFNKWKSGSLQIYNSKEIEQYSRLETTKKLVHIIKSL